MPVPDRVGQRADHRTAERAGDRGADRGADGLDAALTRRDRDDPGQPAGPHRGGARALQEAGGDQQRGRVTRPKARLAPPSSASAPITVRLAPMRALIQRRGQREQQRPERVGGGEHAGRALGQVVLVGEVCGRIGVMAE